MFSSSVAGATPVSRLDCVIGQLCAPEAMSDIAHSPLHNASMPSLEIIREIVHLFPRRQGKPRSS